MAIQTFDVGDRITFTGKFYTTPAKTTLHDPTVVKFALKKDGGTGLVLDYTYGTDAEVVKSSTGIYTVAWTSTERAKYYVRWYATGTGTTAKEEEFEIRKLNAQ